MASAGQGALQPRQTENARRVLDTIPTLVWSAAADGSADFFNQRWLDYTGLTLTEARDWGWTAALHPDERIGLLDYWRSVLASGKRGEIEGRLRHHDGTYRWFLFRAEPLCDENGKVVRWYGTNTDIEDLKQAEYLLAAEKHALEMIADGASLNDILNHVCTSMDILVTPSMTTILLMDPDGKRLWHTAGPRVPREWVPIISPLPVALEAGLCGTAAFLKERIVVPDVATDPNWPDRLRPIAIRNGIRAGWSEPIVAKDRQVLGTFALYSPESRVPTDADLALIEGAGRIALIAIERQRSQEALRTALEEIRKSERELRQIVDTIPGFVCTLSAAGKVEHLNRQTLEYFGKTAEELKNWTTSDAVHADDLPRVIEAWSHAVRTGEPYVMEFRQRRADGAYRWFQSRALPVRDQEGHVSRWYMLLTDIDDRKRAEEALRSREQSLRLMVDSIPGFIATMTAQGELEVANRQSLEYFGKTIDELKNWATGHISHPDDLQAVIKAVSEGVAAGEPFEYEHRARRADGIYRWHQARWYAQRDEVGQIVRWYALVTDIDERKRAEDALEKAYREIRRLTDRLRDENVLLRQQIDQVFMFEEIVGSSPALKNVLASIVQVAPTDSTVLITGETGTGKELIARAIHKRSQRAGRPFVSVNCASIPPSLIASELFGHEKGAFTGAVQRRQGRFELAHGGTIFLDEIGDLPEETQLALLRVIQERTFERVGGNRVIPTDVRIIAATNRDLTAAIDSGAFRADLYYRLNVFPIHVPNLREREEDIPILIEYFVKHYGDKFGKRINKIDRNTLELCASYDWPGNIRELQNIVERSVILCNGDTLRIEQAWLTTHNGSPRHERGSLTQALQSYEKRMIEAALAESNGKVAGPDGAAAKLGIPRSTLDARIKQLHIKRHTVR
jgi:PAS domain S-box-containing protein